MVKLKKRFALSRNIGEAKVKDRLTRQWEALDKAMKETRKDILRQWEKTDKDRPRRMFNRMVELIKKRDGIA